MIRNEKVARVFQVLERIAGRKVLAEPAVLESKAHVSFRFTKATKAKAIALLVSALRKQAGIQLVSEAGNYRATLVASPDGKPD